MKDKQTLTNHTDTDKNSLMQMKTYIYKSRKKQELYLYLSKKDDFSELPEALVKIMGNSPEFVMELELHPEKKLAREDVAVVIHNLKTQGFHVQMPPPNMLIQQNQTTMH